MRDMGTPHQRMQELCDCFAETDFLKEMALLTNDADKDEAALKWLALAVLHGVDRNAKEISLERTDDGTIRAVAEYRDTDLPSPGREIGDKIIDAVRRITHIEDRKGEIPLAVGIRDSSLEIRVKVKRKDGSEKITLKF
ncbi:MAG: hypothetical protein A4E57_04407 [Syntrophorhabdaceae bacterium PtaU1.Bin034]|nr:MAG: hypothetical protein A4E57_04407 [Syntrophorhabdaceae bacterium PtaU1.Bin034]